MDKADADAREVASGLTKAQREAILFIGDGPYDHAISLFGTFWHRPENDGLLRVIRDQLCLTSTLCADARGDGMGSVERLTPLGLRVRAAILQQESLPGGSGREG